MGSPKLTTPMLRVVMLDDTEYHVRALNIDMLEWETYRAKHKLPDPTEAPITWLNYLAWHALQREGLYPEGLRAFEAAAAEVSSAPPTDEAADEVDPTNRVAEPE